MQYPQVIGFSYTLESAFIDLAGQRFVGIQTIKWQETMEGAEMVPGAAPIYIAETQGTYKATCEFDLLWSEYEALCRKLGAGYMQKRFNIGVQVQDVGAGLSSLMIPSCRMIDKGVSLEKSKAAVKNVKCSVLGVITLNGLTAIETGAFGASNAIGGSASVVASVGASLGVSF